MLVSDQIRQLLSTISENNYQIKPSNLTIETYKGENFGHYSSSIPFELAKKIGKTPNDTAIEIIKYIEKTNSLRVSRKLRILMDLLIFTYLPPSQLRILLKKSRNKI